MRLESGPIGREEKLRLARPFLSCAILAALISSAAYSEEHIVRTRRSEWVPSVLFIEPGDTVIWQGMSTHETELIEGMGPEGAFAWNSDIDAEGFSVTFDVDGAYIYSCEVHMGFGMVGAIVVGDGQPMNLAAIDEAIPSVEVGQQFVSRIVDRMKRALARRN